MELKQQSYWKVGRASIDIRTHRPTHSAISALATSSSAKRHSLLGHGHNLARRAEPCQTLSSSGLETNTNLCKLMLRPRCWTLMWPPWPSQYHMCHNRDGSLCFGMNARRSTHFDHRNSADSHQSMAIVGGLRSPFAGVRPFNRIGLNQRSPTSQRSRQRKAAEAPNISDLRCLIQTTCQALER